MSSKINPTLLAILAGVFTLVVILTAFYFIVVDKDPSATGWWSTETDPVTGKVLSCLTVARENAGGVAIYCFEQTDVITP